MSSYTTTIEYNHENELGFVSIDFDLHYVDQRELAERMLDSLEHAAKYGSDETPDEMVPQIVDEWTTTWNSDVAEMWARNKCPEPETPEDFPEHATIIYRMVAALNDLGFHYAYGLLGNAETVAEALERVSTIWRKA